MAKQFIGAFNVKPDSSNNGNSNGNHENKLTEFFEALAAEIRKEQKRYDEEQERLAESSAQGN